MPAKKRDCRLIQMAAGTNPEENFKKALTNVEQRQKMDHRSSASRNSTGRGILRRGLAWMHPCLQKRSRESPHVHFSEIARHYNVVIIVLFTKRGLIGRFYKLSSHH